MTADGSESAGGSAGTDAAWDDLLEDAAEIAEEYREEGWDAVVLEPADVSPVESDDRTGLDVAVSQSAYELVEGLIEDGDVTIAAADVYYRPLEEGDGDRRVALAVERDEETETAVLVPLVYDITACRSVFETALLEAELLVHVAADPVAGRVTFSHDDPSLFLEESDVQAWSEE
ncbi:hypothetical protein A6E15_14165 [Natrinema saccharevitans]|uniref:Uncharacterized protein n=1 Tax=Natrinema saccharevitans TaxID=301967 RepID=A0A1S8AZ74_9EURY|nr:hypothetical protein [Natrinema saccharevitans]OLZ42045.1 hypothetical protein A6E15_14165 [Natrinema saccharevitans]